MTNSIILSLAENTAVEKYYMGLFRRVNKDTHQLPKGVKFENNTIWFQEKRVAVIDKKQRAIHIRRETWLNKDGLNPILLHPYLVPETTYYIYDNENHFCVKVDKQGMIEELIAEINSIAPNTPVDLEMEKSLIWRDGEGVRSKIESKRDRSFELISLQFGGIPEWINYIPVSRKLYESFPLQIIQRELEKEFEKMGNIQFKANFFYFKDSRPDRFTFQIGENQPKSFNNPIASSLTGKSIVWTACIALTLTFSSVLFSVFSDGKKVKHKSIQKQRVTNVVTITHPVEMKKKAALTKESISKEHDDSLRKAMKKNAEIIIQPLKIEYSESNFKMNEEQKRQISQLAKAIKTKVDWKKISIESINTTAVDKNQYRLAKKAAFLVRKELVQNGISIEKIKVIPKEGEKSYLVNTIKVYDI